MSHHSDFVRFFLNALCWVRRRWNVNARDADGMTLLMLACRDGQKEEVERLLACGANPFIKNADKFRAIDVAIRAEQPDLVDLLANAMPPLREVFAASAQRISEAAMYRDAVQAYAAAQKIILRPGDPEEVAELSKLGLPESLVVFYRHYEPWNWLWQVRLYGCADVLWLNEEAWPDLRRLGFFAFASTSAGDVFGFDLNHLSARGLPQIVLFDHEMWSAFSDEEKLASGKLFADDLVDFLEKLAAAALDAEPSDWC